MTRLPSLARRSRPTSARAFVLAWLVVRAPAGAAEPARGVEAEHPAATGSGSPATQPNVVALWIDVALPLERRRALESLVRTELAPHAVTLELDAGHATLPLFIAEQGHDPRVLVAAALDADAAGWKLYVVHVARGRTLERRLPGGVDADAAALEAVATILESAVAALEDGGELGGAATDGARDAASVASPAAASAARDAGIAPSAAPGLRVLGGVGASAAALGDGVVAGGTASIALHFAQRFGARLGVGFYWPKQVSSAYGSFRFQRSALDLRAQALLPLRPLTLAPELGGVLELVRRDSATPAAGVVAASDTTHLRAGALLGLRLSYPLSGFAALELGVHVECYPQALRFVTAEVPAGEIFTLAPVTLAADLGVALGRP